MKRIAIGTLRRISAKSLRACKLLRKWDDIEALARLFGFVLLPDCSESSQ